MSGFEIYFSRKKIRICAGCPSLVEFLLDLCQWVGCSWLRLFHTKRHPLLSNQQDPVQQDGRNSAPLRTKHQSAAEITVTLEYDTISNEDGKVGVCQILTQNTKGTTKSRNESCVSYVLATEMKFSQVVVLWGSFKQRNQSDASHTVQRTNSCKTFRPSSWIGHFIFWTSKHQ